MQIVVVESQDPQPCLQANTLVRLGLQAIPKHIATLKSCASIQVTTLVHSSIKITHMCTGNV